MENLRILIGVVAALILPKGEGRNCLIYPHPGLVPNFEGLFNGIAAVMLGEKIPKMSKEPVVSW